MMFKLALIIVIYSGVGTPFPATSQHEYLYMKEELCNEARDYYLSTEFKNSIGDKNAVVKVNARCMAEDSAPSKKKSKIQKGDGE